MIEDLKHVRTVKSVQKTIGAYDVVIKLTAENNNTLKGIIESKIKKIRNVQYTLTLMELLRE